MRHSVYMSDDTKGLAKAVRDLAKAHSKGLDSLSESIDALTCEIKKLGLAGTTTRLGALETVAKEILNGADSIAGAIKGIAEKLPGSA